MSSPGSQSSTGRGSGPVDSLAGSTVDVAVVDAAAMAFPAWERLTAPPAPAGAGAKDSSAAVVADSARWFDGGRGRSGALIAGGPVTRHDLRSASVLKPLYAYATLAGVRLSDRASGKRDRAPGVGAATLRGWAQGAVSVSDNDATDRLVAAAGGLGELFDLVAAGTGVLFTPGETWGQVPVRARDVATAYAAMTMQAEKLTSRGGTELPAGVDSRAMAYAVAAEEVLAMMDRVPRVQRIGTDVAWVRHVPGPVVDAGVVVKLGWDLDPDGALRTNVVLVDRRAPGSPLVVCLLVASAVTGAVASQWRRALDVEGAGGVLRLQADVHGPGLVLGMSVAQRLHDGLVARR